jgi:putative ABC transport system permease protein
LLHDLRYGFRSLWHGRGFAAAAILCLGFGIGLNAAIFSVLDGVLLQPYPYPDPERLLVIGEQNLKSGDQAGVSYRDLENLRSSSRLFSMIGASTGRNVTLADGGGDPERFLAAPVTSNLFAILGAQPVVGQGFSAVHDVPGGPPVVLIGHDIWVLRYDRDPSIAGRSVLVDGKPHQILGVMPPGFRFPTQHRLWLPLASVAAGSPRDNRDLFVIGRLAPGATPAQARAELDAILQGIARESPSTHAGWTGRLETLRDAFLPDDVSVVLFTMMGSVTLVLFVACANVASLLVARAVARKREISIRAAIGAGRLRIVRQLLTESVALGLASVPLGLGLAALGARLIRAGVPVDQIPYYVTWQIDWRSTAYTIAVAVGTAVVFGLFPALQASRGDLHSALKEGTRGNSAARSPVRSGLVIVQVALAVVALVGALLFFRSFLRFNSADLGFDSAPLMTMRTFMGGEAYRSPDARGRRIEDVVRRIEAAPGVESVFASLYIPIAGGGGGGRIVVDGRPVSPDAPDDVIINAVTPGFRRTLGLSLVAGRDFTDQEGWTNAPVALVTETMARRLWPAGNVVGGRFRRDGPPEKNLWRTVIGVVADFRLYGIDPQDPAPLAAAFVPYAEQPAPNTGLIVRASGEPAAITGAVRAALRASDAGLPLFQVRTMEDVRRLSFWEYGLYSWVFGTTGVVGLLLAAVGVYGVVSYAVSQQSAELGVRAALGATSRDLVRLVVRHGMVLCLTGIAVGLALAPAGTWFGRNLFFGFSPFDPTSFGIVAAVMLAAAFVASYLPARRAGRIDPVITLRSE